MTMTATNRDDQLGEIYRTMLNELNCTFGVSFSRFHCWLASWSWFMAVMVCGCQNFWECSWSCVLYCVSRWRLLHQHLMVRMWLLDLAHQRKATSFEALKLRLHLELDLPSVSNYCVVWSCWNENSLQLLKTVFMNFWPMISTWRLSNLGRSSDMNSEHCQPFTSWKAEGGLGMTWICCTFVS